MKIFVIVKSRLTAEEGSHLPCLSWLLLGRFALSQISSKLCPPSIILSYYATDNSFSWVKDGFLFTIFF